MQFREYLRVEVQGDAAVDGWLITGAWLRLAI